MPLLVRRFERLGHLTRDSSDVVDRQTALVTRRRARCDALGERLALDQLQDQRLDRQPVPRRLALVDAVDRPDVRMVERRQQTRLALEARRRSGLASQSQAGS